MNQKRKIVVDNSFLDSLYILNVLEYLPLLFTSVFIPEQVEREFLNEKNMDPNKKLEFLTRCYQDFPWFQKCNTYDENDIRLLSMEPKMDAGEVEVIAQTKKLGMEVTEPEFLFSGLDEKIGRSVARKHSLQVIGVLKILANMHYLGLLDYFESVNLLHKRKKRFSHAIVTEVFIQTKREYLSGEISLNENS